METTEQLLNRAGTIALRKKAMRSDYFKARWTKPKHNKPHRVYKTVKRQDKFVYVRWTPYIGATMRGLSIKYTVGEFVKLFKLAELKPSSDNLTHALEKIQKGV